MSLRATVLGLFLFTSAASAELCFPQYVPQEENAWSVFTSMTLPSNTIEKFFDANGKLERWTETTFDGRTLTRNIYVVDAFASRTTVTAQVNQGVFQRARRWFVPGDDIDLPSSREDRVKILGQVNLNAGRFGPTDITLNYDGTGRPLYLKMNVPELYNAKDIEIACQYPSPQQVIMTETLYGQTITTTAELNERGQLSRLTRKGGSEGSVTVFGAPDAQRRIAYTTARLDGFVTENGTLLLDEQGRVVNETSTATQFGKETSVTTWEYNAQGQWTAKTLTIEGRTYRTTRTIQN